MVNNINLGFKVDNIDINKVKTILEQCKLDILSCTTLKENKERQKYLLEGRQEQEQQELEVLVEVMASGVDITLTIYKGEENGKELGKRICQAIGYDKLVKNMQMKASSEHSAMMGEQDTLLYYDLKYIAHGTGAEGQDIRVYWKEDLGKCILVDKELVLGEQQVKEDEQVYRRLVEEVGTIGRVGLVGGAQMVVVGTLLQCSLDMVGDVHLIHLIQQHFSIGDYSQMQCYSKDYLQQEHPPTYDSLIVEHPFPFHQATQLLNKGGKLILFIPQQLAHQTLQQYSQYTLKELPPLRNQKIFIITFQ